jgi:hypothetical protein
MLPSAGTLPSPQALTCVGFILKSPLHLRPEKAMHQKQPDGDVTQRLERVAGCIKHDAQKSKILNAALSGFAKAVPDYEPLRQHLLRPYERDAPERTGGEPPFWHDFFRGR